MLEPAAGNIADIPTNFVSFVTRESKKSVSSSLVHVGQKSNTSMSQLFSLKNVAIRCPPADLLIPGQ